MAAHQGPSSPVFAPYSGGRKIGCDAHKAPQRPTSSSPHPGRVSPPLNGGLEQVRSMLMTWKILDVSRLQCTVVGHSRAWTHCRQARDPARCTGTNAIFLEHPAVSARSRQAWFCGLGVQGKRATGASEGNARESSESYFHITSLRGDRQRRSIGCE